MSWYEIVSLVALVLVSGGLTSALFQALKKWTPEKNATRMVLAWVLSVLVALATSWIQGDVLGFLGSWSAGTMTAADVFAYGSILWGIAQATYNRFFKGQTAA